MEVTTRSQAGDGWKIYFLLAMVLWVLSLISMKDPVDGISAVLVGVGLMPIWGYAFGKRIGWRPLWAAYFWFSCLTFTYDLLRGFTLGASGGTAVWVIVLLAGLYAAAGLVAVWRYAYRCPDLWQSGGAAAT